MGGGNFDGNFLVIEPGVGMTTMREISMRIERGWRIEKTDRPADMMGHDLELQMGRPVLASISWMHWSKASTRRYCSTATEKTF